MKFEMGTDTYSLGVLKKRSSQNNCVNTQRSKFITNEFSLN